MADTRLVVDVIGSPHGGELAEQIGLLIAVLGRSQPVDRIRARGFTDLKQLVTDFIDGLVPGNLLPFAVDQFGRILQAALAVTVLANRRALGAMRTLVERVIKSRFLTCPHTILYFGDNAAANRAVRADGFDLFCFTAGSNRRIGFLHHHRRNRRGQCSTTCHQTGIF